MSEVFIGFALGAARLRVVCSICLAADNIFEARADISSVGHKLPGVATFGVRYDSVCLEALPRFFPGWLA